MSQKFQNGSEKRFSHEIVDNKHRLVAPPILKIVIKLANNSLSLILFTGSLWALNLHAHLRL